MPASEVIENPYASPKYDDVLPDAGELLLATTRLYRRMGWAGIACQFLVYLIALFSTFSTRELEVGPTVGMTIVSALMVGFFLFMVRTANRLATNGERSYRRARWLGILAATIYFPILAMPGILAVRRLERYRKRVVEPTHDMQQ